MRIVSLFLMLGYLGTIYCGVVPWSQSKEDQAVYLFKQYCADGSEKGTNPDGARWYCKKSKENTPPVTFLHSKTIHLPSHNSKQIVFIQTPDRTYKHTVRVEGEAEFNHDTDIYVVPGKNDHYVDIQADIQTKEGREGKPHTFYLKNNPSEGKPTPYGSFVPPSEVDKHSHFVPPTEVGTNSYFIPPSEVVKTHFDTPRTGYNSDSNRRHRKRSQRKRQRSQVESPAPSSEVSEEVPSSSNIHTQSFAGFKDFPTF